MMREFLVTLVDLQKDQDASEKYNLSHLFDAKKLDDSKFEEMKKRVTEDIQAHFKFRNAAKVYNHLQKQPKEKRVEVYTSIIDKGTFPLIYGESQDKINKILLE